MTNTDVKFFSLGASLVALLLLGVPPVQAQTQDPAVSAVVEDPSTVVVTEDAPPAATSESSTPEGYPPQPTSVAPAEDASAPAEVGATDVTATDSSTVGAVDAPAPTDVTAPAATAETTAVEVPPADVSAVTSATEDIAPVVTPVAEPSTAELESPTSSPASEPLVEGEVKGTNAKAALPGAKAKKTDYYDAQTVPNYGINTTGSTQRVDPKAEPGQSYVIVEQTGKSTSYEGQYVAASRALKLGRYAAAMEMFEKLYRKNHRDQRVLMGLAIAQQGAGFNESAAKTYEDLLKIDPNNADAMVNLMGIMKTAYPAVTLQKLMELRNRFPTNAGIPAQIGMVSADMKNYDEALRYFEIAASMDPRNPLHLFNMAIVTDKKGGSAQAIKYYERALELDAARGDSQIDGLPRETIYDRLAVLRRKV